MVVLPYIPYSKYQSYLYVGNLIYLLRYLGLRSNKSNRSITPLKRPSYHPNIESSLCRKWTKNFYGENFYYNNYAKHFQTVPPGPLRWKLDGNKNKNQQWLHKEWFVEIFLCQIYFKPKVTNTFVPKGANICLLKVAKVPKVK